jgi:hypothetical protein
MFLFYLRCLKDSIGDETFTTSALYEGEIEGLFFIRK